MSHRLRSLILIALLITLPLPVAAASGLQSITTRDSGSADLVATSDQNTTLPLSLATADLDEDGILDVIAGYGAATGTASGGQLAVHRGNAAAIYPYGPTARAQRMVGVVSNSPFLPDAALTNLPEAPAYMAAADFNGDGHADVLVGAAGSSMLYLLPGDGRGELAKAQPIVLPGQLSGLLSGEFDAPDGLPEVIASLEGSTGAQLAIFASPQGALANAHPPTLIPLSAPALDMTLGHFEGDARPSLAVLTGKQLLLFHGRPSAAFDADQGVPTLETRDLAFPAVALAAGNFSGTELELAILARDGRVFLVSPHAPASRPTSVHADVMAQAAVDGVPISRPASVSQVNLTAPQPVPLGKWQVKLVSSATDLPSSGRLVRVQRAAGDVDGLAIMTDNAPLNGAAPTNQLLSLKSGSDVALRSLPAMIAAISMRVSPDARHGLVYLSANSTMPQVLLPTAGPTFTVNLTGDAADANPADGLCDTDLVAAGAQCTLRAAIIQANALGGPATIHFAIGSGLQKIAPTTQLPGIVVPLTIDGTTQPGYTNAPLIQLSGESLAVGSGLTINSGSTVRGLVVGNFQGSGILIKNATGGNFIENNYVGTDPTGTIANPNGLAGGSVYSGIPGIGVFNSPDNTIGGTNAAAWNLISGNSGSGVVLAEAAAHGNKVQGNYIGTDVTGLTVLSNGLNGVAIDCSNTPGSISGHDNLVGGLSAGAANVISANRGAGVAIECTSANANLVQGNYIGTDKLGTSAVGQGVSAAGVLLWATNSGSVRDNVVGGAVDTARNIISGNTFDGMRLGAYDPASVGITVTNNSVQGNYIGVNVNGSVRPNLRSGIRLDPGAVDNLIGGARPDPTCASPANVISGNLLDGVALSGVQKNRVQGNCIGVGPDGVLPVGNVTSGVRIDRGSTQNLIGGERAPGVCQDVCNTIVGNFDWGVVISDSGTLSNTVRANDIHGNARLAINLVGGSETLSGVTPNFDDVSNIYPAHPNHLTFFPVGVMGTYDANTNQTLISGILASHEPLSATVDLYANSQVDATGFGEGEYYLGHATPSASGVFTFVVAGPLPEPFVSATATDAGGSTSEFGPVCGDPDGNGNIDDDSDGLCDDWELHGIDFDGNGSPDLNLPGLGANPERKDIFIEADYMGFSNFHWDKPTDAALQRVVDAFNNAPVTNTIGQPNGIALHFVGDGFGGYVDERVEHADSILFSDRGPGDYDDFQDIKLGSTGVACGVGSRDAHFGTQADRLSPNCINIIGAKRLVMHYLLFGHTLGENVLAGGVGQWPGSDYLVTVTSRRWEMNAREAAANWHTTTFSEWEDIEAAAVMHELGHNLGLDHGGGDGYGCKPNYLSIMNYSYAFNYSGKTIVPGQKLRTNRPLDYSRQTLPDLVKTELNENVGINGPAGYRALWGVNSKPYVAPADGPIDWNGSGFINTGVLSGYFDINTIFDVGHLLVLDCFSSNNPPGATPLRGYDDWSHLRYNFRTANDYALSGNLIVGGGNSPIEMTADQYLDGVLGSSDYDQDGLLNSLDNCVLVANPNQQDSNGDGVGDVCSLSAVTLTANPVGSGQPVTGTVTLVQAAPAQGAYLELAATPVITSLPLTMTIPASATQGQFNLIAPDVSVTTVVTLTTSWAAHTVTTTLIITPQVRIVHSIYLPLLRKESAYVSGMAFIPAGNFQMGCDAQYGIPIFCTSDQLPLHTVYLDAYFIDKYEVTNAQYVQCVTAGACSVPANPAYTDPAQADSPVIGVNWTQASTYCVWVHKRLPTEAEWEKGSRTPYALMSGGLWEWVNDWYYYYYYLVSPTNNPTGPATGSERVMRGGQYFNDTAFYRFYSYPSSYGPSFYRDFGIRCAAQ